MIWPPELGSARALAQLGDCGRPYSRQAFGAIERAEREHAGGIEFAFRHSPLTKIHPHTRWRRPWPPSRPRPTGGSGRLGEFP